MLKYVYGIEVQSIKCMHGCNEPSIGQFTG